MAYFLVLGSGKGQVPLINKIKELGHSIVSLGPSFEACDFLSNEEKLKINLLDIENILEFARSRKFDAIISNQTDVAVPLWATLAKELNLPGIRESDACLFTDKSAMRERCEIIGVSVPKYKVIEDLSGAISFLKSTDKNIVVKPLNSQGSRGVEKVSREDQLPWAIKNAFENSNPKGSAILEEFCDGVEYVVQGYVVGKKYINLGVAKREYFNSSVSFIPSKTIFNDWSGDLVKKIIRDTKKFVESSSLDFGFIHAEYLVNDVSGETNMVEIAARGGGEFISSHLITHHTGIDFENLLIKNALGEKVYLDREKLLKRPTMYMSFLLPEGKITNVDGFEEFNSSENIDVSYAIKQLNKIDVVKNSGDKTDRFGPILLFGDSLEELDGYAKQVIEKIFISIEKRPNSIIWG